MRKPPTPPDFQEILAEKSQEESIELFEKISHPEVASFTRRMNQKYVHWNKCRYQPPPLDLTPEEAWLAVIISRRHQMSEVDIASVTDNFRFWTPPHHVEMLHKIDQMLGGSISAKQSVGIDQSERERYLVNSLMEEAIASSQLEGALTTRKRAKQLLRTNGKPKSRDEQMIVNNYRAIMRIRELKSRKLSMALLLELHEILTEETFDDPKDVARLRTAEDEVVVEDSYTRETIHLPPPAADLEWRVKQICAFANRRPKTFIHPVLRAIILHFAIGFVHPFVDGNGRVARAVFYWFMLKNDYWLFEFLPISRIFGNAPVQYARAYLYTETDHSDLTYFIDYNLHVIRRATQELHKYIVRQQAHLSTTLELVSVHPSLNRRQANLIYYAIRHSTVAYTIRDYRAVNNIGYATARADLLALCELGFFQRLEDGKTHYFRPVANLAEKLQTSIVADRNSQEVTEPNDDDDVSTIMQLKLF